MRIYAIRIVVMFRELRDFCYEIVFPVSLLSAAVVVVFFGIAEGVGRYTCNSYAEATGRHAEWRTLDDCYVMTDMGLQPRGEFVARQTASALKD